MGRHKNNIELEPEIKEEVKEPVNDSVNNQVNESEVITDQINNNNDIPIENVIAQLSDANKEPEIIQPKERKKYTKRVKEPEPEAVKSEIESLPIVLTEPVVKLGLDLYIEKLLKV